MGTTILTSYSAEELKALLKEIIVEILGERLTDKIKQTLPDLMDIKQAAAFLNQKVNTLYDKTHRRIIPHIKKGNKLYFDREELERWLRSGKVETTEEIARSLDEQDFKNHQKRS